MSRRLTPANEHELDTDDDRLENLKVSAFASRTTTFRFRRSASHFPWRHG